jgi:alkyl sulfatase BDS1-like metallo-beta-lactamase superfamily hydrolase
VPADFEDRTDFENATRGLIARLEPGVIKAADLAVTLTKPQLLAMLAGAGTDGAELDGDPKTFATIAGFTDEPDPSFATVTP